MNPAPLLALLTLLLLGATPPNLAVLELADRAGLRPAEADYLTDLVRTTAGRRPGLRVLTREDIIERLPPGTDLAACEADCEIEIGRRLGADFVISGEIIDFAGELRVLLRLHATRTATLLAGERAGALRLADLETPIESATARLLDRTGVAGPDPANATAPNPLEAPIAPRLAPITFARVVPRAGPHIPPALFLTRAEPLAAEDHHAADAALVAQIRTAPQPERTALTLRRGLLARDAAAAITLRAYFAEDTCLARAPDAAARARCAADRAARTREAEAAHRLVIATLAPLVDPANAAITAHADHADHDDRADRANRTDPAGHSNPANRNNIADRNNTADHSNPVDYNNPADPAARPHRTAPAAPLAQADTALLALADAHRALADHAAARRAIDHLTTRHPRSPHLPDARLLLALMFTDEGRDDFADAALRDLTRAHPGAAVAPYARYLLAWTLLRRDKHRPAITWLRRVLRDTHRARADHPADRAEAILRRDARADLVQAWADNPRARLDAAFPLFAQIDPTGALHLPEALAELYLAQGRRGDARAVLDRLRATLAPRCRAGETRACGETERLCASYGGAACPAD